MRTDRRAEWFAAVERTTELPLLILAVAMVPLLVLPFVLDLSAGVEATFLALDWTIWGIFGLELVVKTYLAPARRSYLRQHWFDVLIVVVPVLRPLRVARSARALRAVRMLRVGAVLARISLTARPILTRHGLQHAVLLSGLLVVVGSIATTLFERNGGGSIGDFGTTLWWALATVTTVGYGDATPATAAGRGVGVMLMFVGIGVFSLLAANVAAYFVEQDAAAGDQSGLNSVANRLHELETQIASLRADLAGADRNG